jgi:DNA-binding response OmpR family regulator
MRILVIEDNPKLLAAIQRGLQEQGHCVDACEGGFLGEDLAVATSYDAIVLDRMLPDRDGVEVCRSLRRRDVRTPILMLTALSSTSHKVEGLDAGADDYLTKPFEFEELIARVRALLRRGHSTESTELVHGALVLDLLARRATRGGQRIKLSTKEFALLEFMVRNPERVLARTLIAEKLWDMSYEPTSNVIDVYVSSLRKKLDRDFERKLIHTVVGVGYRFGEPEGGAAHP